MLNADELYCISPCGRFGEQFYLEYFWKVDQMQLKVEFRTSRENGI